MRQEISREFLPTTQVEPSAHNARRLLSLPRFYCPEISGMAGAWPLPDEVFHHAVRVRRLKVGRSLVLLNGQGGEYEVVLQKIERHQAWVETIAFHAIERELGRALTLMLALPAAQTMDTVVEKATELGVQTLQPMYSAHSSRFANEAALAKKMAHWQMVAIHACEQCGRNTLPVLKSPIFLADALTTVATEGIKVWLSPNGELWHSSQVPTLLQASDQPIYAFIGPEGGFSAEEEKLARTQGFVALNLGPTILRVETAVIAALNLCRL